MRLSDPPQDALVFVAHGNYGSALFDPTGPGHGESLEVYLCDACLEAASSRGLVNHVQELPAKPEFIAVTWKTDRRLKVVREINESLRPPADWWTRPNPGFQGRRPKDVSTTELEEMLYRLESGEPT